MTVREFTSQLWYIQKIAIIKWKAFEQCNDIDDIRHKALMVGNNYELRSVIYDNINDMLVDRYGAMDDMLVIEVE